MKQDPKGEEVGILQVFKARKDTKQKDCLPLLFAMRLSKGAEVVYMSYARARKEHPYRILQMFQRLAVVKDEKDVDNFAETSEELFAKQEVKQQARQDARQQAMQVEVRQKASPAPLRKSKRYIRSLGALKQQFQCPPVLQLKRKKQQFRSQNIDSKDEEQDNNDNANEQSMQKSQSSSEQSQQKKIKILDYDNLILELGWLVLPTPAIIPKANHKSQTSRLAIQLSTNTNFKQFQREAISDEQFRESESQFQLNDRGRDRKRRERLQAMQNTRPHPIKKKKKKVQVIK